MHIVYYYYSSLEIFIENVASFASITVIFSQIDKTEIISQYTAAAYRKIWPPYPFVRVFEIIITHLLFYLNELRN